MISIITIFLLEVLILILSRINHTSGKNIIPKLARNDEITIMICSKDDKLCLTINYVSGNINYVPCIFQMGGLWY